MRLDNGNIRIYPEKYYNPQKPCQGLVSVEEDMIEITNAENKREEVTSDIIEILNRKYR